MNLPFEISLEGVPNSVWLGIAVAGIMMVFVLSARVIGGFQERSRRRAALRKSLEEGKLLPPEPTREKETLDDWFERTLSSTGANMNAAQGMAILLFFIVGLGGTVFLWRENVYLAAAAGLAGLIFPLMIFRLMAYFHSRKIQSQLPDVIAMMARSVRAGLTLDQAVDMAGRQCPMPVAAEFRKASSQIKLGLPVHDALAAAAKRVRLVDLDALVTTVGVYNSTGGNLPMIMDRLAQVSREHNAFRGYFLAATAQGRVTAVFLGLAAPALLLLTYLTQPEWFDLFIAHPLAPWLLTGCAILEIIGVVWLFRILRVDY